MKIRVRDNNAISKVPGILFITFFGISSTGVIIGSSERFNGNYKLDEISQVFNDLGIVSLFASIFLCVSLFLLMYLLKLPKRCTSTILSVNDNVEENIKNVELLIKDGTREVICECQTALANEIDINKEYVAYVKEFNWEVKFLEELDKQKFNDLFIRTKKIKLLGMVTFLFVIIRIIVFGG